MVLPVNGVELYYEKTGQGPPMVLLHGNGESHEKLGGLVRLLKKDYTCYAIDSRGHGRSSPVEEIGYGIMMEDVAAFIMALGLEKPILLGTSDGAIIGLMLAIAYPNSLSALISCGANTHPAQLKKWFLAVCKLGWYITRDPKMRMMFTEPNITPGQLAMIKVPTLVLAGARDILPRRYTEEIVAAIPRSTLCILPGETHGSYIKHSERLYTIMQSFLRKLGREK